MTAYHLPKKSATAKKEKSEVREERLHILARASPFFCPLSKDLNHPSKGSSHRQTMLQLTGNVIATYRSPTHAERQREAKAGSSQGPLPYLKDANTNSLAGKSS